MKITVKKQRKDNKFLVEYFFEGEPDAFGGYYPSKVFNKIKTLEQIKESNKSYVDFVNLTSVDDNLFIGE